MDEVNFLIITPIGNSFNIKQVTCDFEKIHEHPSVEGNSMIFFYGNEFLTWDNLAEEWMFIG